MTMVVFRDHNEPDGVGIIIEFMLNERVKHTEFLGDEDYNGAIVDWILFEKYKPLAERRLEEE